MENLIPLGFYKETFKSEDFTESHARYKFLEDNGLLHIAHLDFKDGVQVFSDIDDNEICEFWFEPVNKYGINVITTPESNFSIKGFGNNILKLFLDYDRDKIFNEVSAVPHLKEQWLSMGGILSSFVSGTKRIRAI